jgi:hypothetical protein
MVEYRPEECHGLNESDLCEILWECADFEYIHKAVALEYIQAFASVVNGEFGLNITLTAPDKFLDSPREYNFATDRIFALISWADLRAVYKATGWDKLCAMAKERFTSRSGFISFYESDPKQWGKRQDWDHNQTGTLLAALCSGLDDLDLQCYYATDDRIGQAVDNGIDWAKVDTMIADKAKQITA